MRKFATTAGAVASVAAVVLIGAAITSPGLAEHVSSTGSTA